MKFEYIYVNVKNATFWSAKSYEHREIIDDYARKGYRYVGFVPTTIEGYGRITSFDLVFEKAIDENAGDR